MLDLTLAIDNIIGPFPVAPYAIEIAGIAYVVTATNGLDFQGDNKLHWDPAFRGFPLLTGSQVTVHFSDPGIVSAQQAAALAIDVETAALTPRRVIIDGNTIEERSMDELISADKYERATAALCGGPWLRNQKFYPLGAVGSGVRYVR